MSGVEYAHLTTLFPLYCVHKQTMVWHCKHFSFVVFISKFRYTAIVDGGMSFTSANGWHGGLATSRNHKYS